MFQRPKESITLAIGGPSGRCFVAEGLRHFGIENKAMHEEIQSGSADNRAIGSKLDAN